MGGAMALHLAGRYHPEVAGVFALSSFLNKDSVAFQVSSYHTSATSAFHADEVTPWASVCVCVCFRPLKSASGKACPSPRCSSATAPRMSWCPTDGERRPRRCCRRLA